MSDDPDAGRAGQRAKTYAPIPEWVLLSGISPQAIAVYAVLLAHTNREDADGRAFPGLELIAEILGFKQRKSVSNYLRELVAIRAIKVARTETGAKRHNEYVVYELPPPGLQTPETLQDVHNARRKARRTRGTAVPVARGTEVPTAGGTEMPRNQRNGTGGREPEEIHASSEDAPAGAHEQARVRANDSSKRIHIVYPVATDETEMTRKLVASAIKATEKAGRTIGSRGASAIGSWLKDYPDVPLADRVREIENTLNLALAGDQGFAYLFEDVVKAPARANTIDALDELHDDYDGVPGSAAIDNLAGQGYHPQAIENIVLKTREAMA